MNLYLFFCYFFLILLKRVSVLKMRSSSLRLTKVFCPDSHEPTGGIWPMVPKGTHPALAVWKLQIQTGSLSFFTCQSRTWQVFSEGSWAPPKIGGTIFSYRHLAVRVCLCKESLQCWHKLEAWWLGGGGFVPWGVLFQSASWFFCFCSS